MRPSVQDGEVGDPMNSSAMAIGVGLLLGGCTVGGEGEIPLSGPPTTGGVPCGDFEIDGAFTQGAEGCGVEWAGITPLRGSFGDLYVGVDSQSHLIVLNDWHLRDDEPASAEMYNLFCLATDLGVFEVRVFGDQHVEAWLDGERIDQQVVGATGFGSSPLTPTPHTIFEFRLGTLPTTMRVLECDPAGGTVAEPALPPGVVLAGEGGCYPGSGPAVPHNLVREPNIFEVELEPTGVRAARITRAPILLGTDATVIAPGAEITIHGAQLAEGGSVLVDGVPVEAVAWSDARLTVRLPDSAGETVEVRVEVRGAVSNTLSLRSRCAPSCPAGEVCRRGSCQREDLD